MTREARPRLRILELGMGWGLGGTEQAVEIRAALLPREFFEVYVVGVGGGPRFDRLIGRGVPGERLDGDLSRLSRVLKDVRPDLLHYTRSERICGYSERVQELCQDAAVKVVVETNVFGRPAGFCEPRPPDLTAHMSLASMLRCARLSGTPLRDLYATGHRAVYLPVPTPEGYGVHTPSSSRADARRELGVADDELLACRVTRPDLRKWSSRLELALPRLFRQVPNLRFAFMAAPPEKARGLARRFGSKVLCLPPSHDLASIASLCGAADLMVHSSGIGESFGLSVAEGMFYALPVVVDSTPEADNAQIELVEHGKTGFVVRSGRGFVEAVARLARDRDLRAELARAARARAQAHFADTEVVRQWTRLYAEACAKKGCSPNPALEQHARAVSADPSPREHLEFEEDYARRERSFLGPSPGLLERTLELMLRAGDTVGYARTLGPGAVWRVARSRFKARRIGRD